MRPCLKNQTPKWRHWAMAGTRWKVKALVAKPLQSETRPQNSPRRKRVPAATVAFWPLRACHGVYTRTIRKALKLFYVNVLSPCMYVYYMCVWRLQRSVPLELELEMDSSHRMSTGNSGAMEGQQTSVLHCWAIPIAQNEKEKEKEQSQACWCTSVIPKLEAGTRGLGLKANCWAI